MAAIPASIRNKNPGAMYPGKSATKFGATVVNIIGGGHKIAEFPSHIHGAAALFDLLRRFYCGLSVLDAITKWSGGNHVDAYLASLAKSGIKPGDILSSEVLATPDDAIRLAKAMAKHEAGKAYPMTDDDWRKAFALSINGPPVEDADAPAVWTETDTTPWLTIAHAYRGVHEDSRPGEHNAKVLGMFALCGRPDVNTDETPWCAAFVGACLRQAGYDIPPTYGRDFANIQARSYVRYGAAVKPRDVRPGDIFTEARGSYPSGHVGFVESVDHKAGTFRATHGNTSNQVKIDDEAPRPISGVLAFRRPLEANKPVVETVRESQSLKSIFGVIAVGFSWAATKLGELFGLLPSAVDTAGPTVQSVNTVGGWLGFSIPPSVYAVAALAALTVAFIRLVQEKRQ